MTKFWVCPNWKHFADDNFNIAQFLQLFLDRVENIVGKGENAGHQNMNES